MEVGDHYCHLAFAHNPFTKLSVSTWLVVDTVGPLLITTTDQIIIDFHLVLTNGIPTTYHKPMDIIASTLEHRHIILLYACPHYTHDRVPL